MRGLHTRAALLLFAAVNLSAQSGLAPEAERGRQIYERGVSTSGNSLEASLGGDTTVPGSVMPCANCHGRDGLGKAESGIYPSKLTWDALTKPYLLTNSDGRVRPPYTERLLKRAIAMGIDSGGNTLNDAMPRFQMSQGDASDLIAYLKKLGNLAEPGLAPSVVRLGVLLPPPQAGQAAAIMKQTLVDSFARVNKGGGIFGRRIELVFAELPAEPERRADSVHAFLCREEVFAVLGDFSGAEQEIAATLLDTGTPALAVLAPFPQPEAPVNRFVFYLDGGAEDELRALVDFASAQFPGPDRSIEIVQSEDEASSEAVQWLEKCLANAGRRRVTIREGKQPLQADVVFWLRSPPGVPSVPAVAHADTVVLIPGASAPGSFASDLFPGARVFFAIRAVTTGEDTPTASRVVWNRATAAASLVTEALTVAGRGLSRSTWIDALEGLRDVETNLASPVSFGPDKHIGASGVRIMQYDAASGKLQPLTGDGRRQ